MLRRFMVKPAAEQRKPAMNTRASTWSRAGRSVSIDNRVMERFGTLMRGA
jgi:hypothetical protein